MRRISKLSKFLAVAALVGFFSVLADMHLEEYSSKQTSQQNDTCCVTCCPAHHLGPTEKVSRVEPVKTLDWEIPVEIAFYSKKSIVSIFHPPRFLA